MLPKPFCPRNLQHMIDAASSLHQYIKATQKNYKKLISSKDLSKTKRINFFKSGFLQLRANFKELADRRSKYAGNRVRTAQALQPLLENKAIDRSTYNDSLGDLLAFANCLLQAMHEDIGELHHKALRETKATRDRLAKLFSFHAPIDARGCSDDEWRAYSANISEAKAEATNLLSRFEDDEGFTSFPKFLANQPDIEAQEVSFSIRDLEFEKFTADHIHIKKQLDALAQAELELTALNYWREYNDVAEAGSRKRKLSDA
jgi:hypothetical protein